MMLGLSAENAMNFWLWASRLWPLLLPLVLLAFPPRARAGAFVVFGVLVCYGVQSVVGMFSVELPAGVPEGENLAEKFFSASLAHLARTLLISAVLSLVVLVWLRRVLRPSPT